MSGSKWRGGSPQYGALDKDYRGGGRVTLAAPSQVNEATIIPFTSGHGLAGGRPGVCASHLPLHRVLWRRDYTQQSTDLRS